MLNSAMISESVDGNVIVHIDTTHPDFEKEKAIAKAWFEEIQNVEYDERERAEAEANRLYDAMCDRIHEQTIAFLDKDLRPQVENFIETFPEGEERDCAQDVVWDAVHDNL